MATVAYPASMFSPSPMATMSFPPQQQQQPPSKQHAYGPSSTHASSSATSTSLRRAVYVHVSDLTSAYNIDHTKLEEELARVKAEQEQKQQYLDISPNDSSSVASASAGVALLGVPTELDTSSASHRRLQPPRMGYNLCVLVGKLTVVVDKRRVDGTRVRLAEVEVGDETGIVSFRARDDQIDVLEEVSSRTGAVVLRNCTLELYQGRHIRLAVTKWGKISRYPDQVASTPAPPSKINRDRNFSLIDLSKVASEMITYAGGGMASSAPPTDHPYHHSHLEAENQANRAQSYTNAGRGGRGRRLPGPGRAKSVPSGQHYGDGSAPLAGPPPVGYGFPGAMDTTSPYLYNPRQADTHPSQQQAQHLMMHQQYEMQQQQQQHHRPMHQPPPPPPPPPPVASHMYPGPDRLGSTPMVVSPTGIAPAGSFDSFGLPPPMSNPFMVPIASSSATSSTTTSAPPPPHTVGPFPPSHLPGASRSDSPAGSKIMNPQAPTYDPTSSYHRK